VPESVAPAASAFPSHRPQSFIRREIRRQSRFVDLSRVFALLRIVASDPLGASGEYMRERIAEAEACARIVKGFIAENSSDPAAASNPERDFALTMLLFSAKTLALSHMERYGRLRPGQDRVPICDTCRSEGGHAQGCAVGLTLHWINEFMQTYPVSAAPAPRASSPAGDLSRLDVEIEREIVPAVRNQPDGYFGEVERGRLEPEPAPDAGPACVAPVCGCDATTRCAGGCTFPSCHCSEENRCAASYPSASELKEAANG